MRLLINPEGLLYIALTALNRKDVGGRVDSNKRMTLYMRKIGKTSGYSLLEVTKMQGDPEYFAVTGIWVPRRSTSFEEIGALIEVEILKIFIGGG